MNYLELLKLAAPETILVVAALVVLSADLLALRGLELATRRLITGMIASVGALAAIAWMLALPQNATVLKGMFVLDPVRQIVKIALLALTIFTLLLSLERRFTKHPGEYCALVLLTAIGMMFLVSTEDILMIFISLELTSLSLYILTAFAKDQLESAEAALKYFLFGGMSAAFTLFGLSFLYGISGSTNLRQIAASIHGPSLDPLLLLALVMTVVGFGFKVAAAPFHLWAPDTYQGAPTPSAAFIASGSKVAVFFIFAQVMALGFAGAEGNGGWGTYSPGWLPLLAILATLSIVLGNLAAIVQTSVRRLLAYSAIAHGGYMLLGVMSSGPQGLASLVYYVITYALTTLGAFAVVAVIQEQTGCDRLTDFAGLSRRAPLLSFCLMIFLLSLAGIPPLAGFFGKFFVFASALASPPTGMGVLWLVVLALAMSAVSLYYYLQVLKQVYVAPGSNEPLHPPVISQVTIALLAFLVFALGCAPQWVIASVANAVQLARL